MSDAVRIMAKVEWRDATLTWIARCPWCQSIVWSVAPEWPGLPKDTPRGPLAIGNQVPREVEIGHHRCESLVALPTDVVGFPVVYDEEVERGTVEFRHADGRVDRLLLDVEGDG